MKNKAIYIKQVLNKSLAKKAGIKAGDFLLSINGRDIKDIFDYQYLISSPEIELEILRCQNEELVIIEIKKDPDEDLGLVFEKELIDDEKSCHNKCIFCFIDQLPVGMRDSLYFKDDDARLSFLTGNYVTLTNMSKEDVIRIADMHLSPVNISVHTTDMDLRCKMLSNRFAGDLLEKMQILAKAGIEMNCQIVLCKDVNDKENLDKTIDDLYGFYPSVKSVSVVPVGITKYRKGLHPLDSFTSSDCKDIIKQVSNKQDYIKKEIGYNFIYASDEFYIKGNVELPDFSFYDDFFQIENGVGLMTNFMQSAYNYLATALKDPKKARKVAKRKGKVSIATGYLAYKYIKEITDRIKEKAPNLEIFVHKIRNEFFGDTITVTGLLTGQDLVKGLEEKDLGELLLVSQTMFKSDQDIFLDDMTLKDLQKQLKTPIKKIQNQGEELVKALIG